MGKFFTKFKSIALVTMALVILTAGFTGCFEKHDDKDKDKGKVIVSVMLSDNVAVEGAVVSIAGQSGRTDAAGKVTFNDVEENNYTLQVAGKDAKKGSDGYKAGTMAVSVKGASTSIVITVEKVTIVEEKTGTLIVSVVDSTGKPIANAEVLVGNITIGRTGASGEITAPGLPYGIVTVDVELADGVANKSVTIDSATKTATFTFAVKTVTTTNAGVVTKYDYCEPKGTLVGQVVDQYGNPVSGATISFGYGVVETDKGGGFKQTLIDIGGAGTGGPGEQDNTGANDHNAFELVITASKANYAPWTLEADFFDDTLVNDDVLAQVDLTNVTQLDVTAGSPVLGGTIAIPLKNSAASVKIVLYQLVTMRGTIVLPEATTEASLDIAFDQDIKCDTIANSNWKVNNFIRNFKFAQKDEFKTLTFDVPNLILTNNVDGSLITNFIGRVSTSRGDTTVKAYADYYVSLNQEHDLAPLPDFSLESYTLKGDATTTTQAIVDFGNKTAFKYYTLKGSVYKTYDINDTNKVKDGAIVKLDTRADVLGKTDFFRGDVDKTPAVRQDATDAFGNYLITEILPGAYKIQLLDFDEDGNTIPEYINGKNYLNATIGYGKTEDIFQQGVAGGSTGYILKRDMWFEGAYDYSISGTVEAGLLGQTYPGMEVKVYSVDANGVAKLEGQTLTNDLGKFTITKIVNKNVFVTVEARDIDGNGVANFLGVEEIGLVQNSLQDKDTFTEAINNTDNINITDVKLFMPANVADVATGEPNYFLLVKETNFTQNISNKLDRRINALEPDADITITFNIAVSPESINDVIAANEPFAWIYIKGTNTTIAAVTTLTDNNKKLIINPDKNLKDDSVSIKINEKLKPAKFDYINPDKTINVEKSSKASGYSYGSKFILNEYYFTSDNPKYTNFATGELYVDVNTEDYILNVVETSLTKKNEYGKFINKDDKAEFLVNITDLDAITLTFDKDVYIPGGNTAENVQAFWASKLLLDPKDKDGNQLTPNVNGYKFNNKTYIGADFAYDDKTFILSITPKLVACSVGDKPTDKPIDYNLSIIIDTKVYPKNTLQFYEMVNDIQADVFDGWTRKVNIAKHSQKLWSASIDYTNVADIYNVVGDKADGVFVAKKGINPDGDIVIQYAKAVSTTQVAVWGTDLSKAYEIWYNGRKLDPAFFDFSYTSTSTTSGTFTITPNIEKLKENGQWFNEFDANGDAYPVRVMLGKTSWVGAQANETPFERMIPNAIKEIRFPVDLDRYRLKIVSGNFFEKDNSGQFRYTRKLNKDPATQKYDDLTIKFNKEISQASLDYILKKGLQAVYVADVERDSILDGAGTSYTYDYPVSVNVKSVVIDTDTTQLKVTLERDLRIFTNEHKYYVAVNTLLMSEEGFASDGGPQYWVAMKRLLGDAGMFSKVAGHPLKDLNKDGKVDDNEIVREGMVDGEVNGTGVVLDTKSFTLKDGSFDIPLPLPPKPICQQLETIAIVPFDKADYIFVSDAKNVVLTAVAPSGIVKVENSTGSVDYPNAIDVDLKFNPDFKNFRVDWNLKKAAFYKDTDRDWLNNPLNTTGVVGVMDISGVDIDKLLPIRIPVEMDSSKENFIGNDGFNDGLKEYLVYAKYSQMKLQADGITDKLIALNDWKLIQTVPINQVTMSDKIRGFTRTMIDLSLARGLPVDVLGYRGQIDITIIPVSARDGKVATLPDDKIPAERTKSVFTIKDEFRPDIIKLNNGLGNLASVGWTNNKIEVSEFIQRDATITVTGINTNFKSETKFIRKEDNGILFDLVPTKEYVLGVKVTPGAIRTMTFDTTDGLYEGMLLDGNDVAATKIEIIKINSSKSVEVKGVNSQTVDANTKFVISSKNTDLFDRVGTADIVQLNSATKKLLKVENPATMSLTKVDKNLMEVTGVTRPLLGFKTNDELEFIATAPAGSIALASGSTDNRIGFKTFNGTGIYKGTLIDAPLADKIAGDKIKLIAKNVDIRIITSAAIRDARVGFVGTPGVGGDKGFVEMIRGKNIEVAKGATKINLDVKMDKDVDNLQNIFTATSDIFTANTIVSGASNVYVLASVGGANSAVTTNSIIKVTKTTDVALVSFVLADQNIKAGGKNTFGLNQTSNTPVVLYFVSPKNDDRLIKITGTVDNSETTGTGIVLVTSCVWDDSPGAMKADDSFDETSKWAFKISTIEKLYRITVDNTKYKVPLDGEKGNDIKFEYITDGGYKASKIVKVKDIFDATAKDNSKLVGLNQIILTDTYLEDSVATNNVKLDTSVDKKDNTYFDEFNTYSNDWSWTSDKEKTVTIKTKVSESGIPENSTVVINEEILDFNGASNGQYQNLDISKSKISWLINEEIVQKLTLKLNVIGAEKTTATAIYPTSPVSKYTLTTAFKVVTPTKPQILFDTKDETISNAEALEYMDLSKKLETKLSGPSKEISDSYVKEYRFTVNATEAEAKSYAGKDLSFGLTDNDIVLTSTAIEFAVGDKILGNKNVNPYKPDKTNISGTITAITPIYYSGGYKYKYTLTNSFADVLRGGTVEFKPTIKFTVDAKDTSGNKLQTDADDITYDLEVAGKGWITE